MPEFADSIADLWPATDEDALPDIGAPLPVSCPDSPAPTERHSPVGTFYTDKTARRDSSG